MSRITRKNKKKRAHEYISFRRYIHRALNGREIEIPAGTRLINYRGMLLLPNGDPVCTTHSENGRQHFAANYDGEGMERGRLTYAITQSPRQGRHGFRMNATEGEWLSKNWSQYLTTGDSLLFNDDFYAAPLIHLRAIADYLNIRFSDDIIVLKSKTKGG